MEDENAQSSDMVEITSPVAGHNSRPSVLLQGPLSEGPKGRLSPITKKVGKQQSVGAGATTGDIASSTKGNSSGSWPQAPQVQQRVTFAGPTTSATCRLAGLSDADITRTFQDSLRHRRTSLPATSALIANRAPLDNSVREARGIILDMLETRDLSPSVASCLRAVASLLNPQPPPCNLHEELGLPMVIENPYSGEQLVVSPATKPRLSNITFSTVTSATGLPTIAAEPSRPRSSSYWKPSDREPRSADHSTSPHPLRETNVSARDTATKIGREASGRLASSDAESSVSGTSSRSSCDFNEEVVQTADGMVYDTRELETDHQLVRISEWAFPIFEFGERNKATTLSKIAYAIFKQFDLFRIFKISLVKFFNFFHALERGYWDIPYHNRFHAADVMHGCFYLTCHPVKTKFGDPDAPGHLANDSYSMPIADSMSTLELMALYTAAAMHDYDHPGRTNAFLVASEDRKAILYNDRSVLENHHAAESWKLLCKPENSFIETFDAAEAKRFRFLVLEYILATDLKQHFDIISEFREKAPEMDLTNESDRVIISQMLIKFADINSPTKPYDLHVQWTRRLCEEFYSQGDEEKRLGLAVSPYMDRNEPAVAKLQDSFISHMVAPLAHALNEAGLLPCCPGLPKAEVLMNLEYNHTRWLNELEQQRVEEEEQDQLTPAEETLEENLESTDHNSDTTTEEYL